MGIAQSERKSLFSPGIEPSLPASSFIGTSCRRNFSFSFWRRLNSAGLISPSGMSNPKRSQGFVRQSGDGFQFWVDAKNEAQEQVIFELSELLIAAPTTWHSPPLN
jgi:hypothetical protein